MNPFDQFSGALNDALPSSNGSVAPTVISQQQPPQQQQFNIMAQPTPEKKPVMNTGMMMPNQQQQPPQGGMYGQQQPNTQGMYGQTQIQPQGGMYGQAPVPPPQQQMMAPTQSMMGGFGQMNSNGSMGVPPPTPNSNGMGAAMQLTNQPSQNNVMAGALVPSTQQSNPYALGGAADAAAANPFGAPQQNNQLQQQQQPNSFGAATQVTPQTSGQMMAMDPFGTAANNQPPPAQQQQQLAAVDPWGSQPTNNMGGGASVVPSVAPVQQQSNALVPSGAPPSDDPFGVFGGGGSQSVAPSVAAPSAIGGAPSVSAFGDQTVISQQQYQQQQQPPAQQPPSVIGGGDDPWAEMGFGSPTPAPSGPVPGEDDDLFNTGLQPTREAGGSAAPPKPPVEQSTPKSPSKKKNKPGELPPGGEWYDAKIFTPTLGVMFFKPKELVDSLFLQTDKKMVDQLEERPVVAFIVEGSSARSAGVELGHVLLKVNGIDVKNPKEASRLIKEGPRPLPLLFYVPETNVVVAEGEHMVKYNTKETGAPNSAKDWKPKYVVIGGIIAQPWMMNMYRSKSEYDIAVIETQARRPVSVKVKQFSLQGARIQNDWQGPQMVKYKNKLHPWKYIVILPISRNPIKIASPNLSQLKPVHEGIRRLLQSQQRDRGGGGRGAGPSRGQDSYGGGGYDTRGRNGNDHRGMGTN